MRSSCSISGGRDLALWNGPFWGVRGDVETARLLLARGAAYDLVELLLARGAPTNLADDAGWATPLAWATRRGHDRIVELLRAAGATA